MKNKILLFVISLLITGSASDAWSRINEYTVFNAYLLGNIEPNQVSKDGYVVGVDQNNFSPIFEDWITPSHHPTFYSHNLFESSLYNQGDSLSSVGLSVRNLSFTNIAQSDTQNYTGNLSFAGQMRGFFGIRNLMNPDENKNILVPTLGGNWSKLNGGYNGTYFGVSEDSDGISRAITVTQTITNANPDHPIKIEGPSTSAAVSEIRMIEECFPANRGSSANDLLDVMGRFGVGFDENSLLHFIGNYRAASSLSARSFYIKDSNWTLTSPMNYRCVDLGTLGGSATEVSVINDLSAEYWESTGELDPFRNNVEPVVVGWSRDSQERQRAYYATISGGVTNPLQVNRINLGVLGDEQYSTSAATGVNWDGVAVGWSYDSRETDSKAFIYIPRVGMRDLNRMLVNPEGEWRLIRANYISKKSDYIVGVGYYTPTVRIYFNGVWIPLRGTPQRRGFILAPMDVVGSKETIVKPWAYLQ